LTQRVNQSADKNW